MKKREVSEEEDYNDGEEEEDEELPYQEGESEQKKIPILDNIINGSSPETTGKFGTGFLTTHLLSREVEISGVYVNAVDSALHHQFTMRLDRRPRTKVAMIKNYKEVSQKLETFDDPNVCPLIDNYVSGL